VSTMPRSKPQAEDEGEADAPKKMTRRGLTSSEKTDLTEVFALCDSDSSGLIDWQELRRALRGLGFPVSKKESRALLRQADKHDEIGLIEASQFLEIVESLSLADHARHREIVGAYRLFDKTGSGGITGTDLKQLAHDVGETFTMSEIEDMLNTADLNGDGKIDVHEFEEILMKTNLFRSNQDEEK